MTTDLFSALSATEAAHQTDFVVVETEAIAIAIDDVVDSEQRPKVLGKKIVRLLQPVIKAGSVTVGVAVRLALLSDCLHIAESAIMADGIISCDEIAYAGSLTRAAARQLARIRPQYGGLLDDPDFVKRFIPLHRNDSKLFGGACTDTEWLGWEICRRAAEETGDVGPFRSFQRMLVRLVDDVHALGTGTLREQQEHARLKSLIDRRVKKRETEVNDAESRDPRIAAFCSDTGPEVFHAIAHAQHIWKRDPYDVEGIHSPTREAFERALDRPRMGRPPGFGRILLMLGESGSGKTHLARAFRNRVHTARIGYGGYLQLSTDVSSYERYTLVKVLESLEQPYDDPEVKESGLMCLSDAVVETAVSDADRKRLQDEPLGAAELGRFASELADQLLRTPQFESFDVDLLRTMLYLQRRDPPIRQRVLKYLRCEHLTPYDRELLGDMAPLTREEAPLRVLGQLGRLMWASGESTLLLLFDQLEDIRHLPNPKERFSRVASVIRHLSDHVPTAIIVVACLEDYYTEARNHLDRSTRDRLENDPAPLNLTSRRTSQEIEELVSRRLECLFDFHGVRPHDEQPLFPFTTALLKKIANMRTRDVLESCRDYQERCVEAGHLVDTVTRIAKLPPEPTQAANFDRLWDDFRANNSVQPPDSDAEMATLLAW
ncbi:ATP-binding protein, partial [Planctomycetota bacterium]